MTGPLRFFCHHCTQMIKIGRQMAGRSVVCPQCGTRLAVPLQSDPAAEAVYTAQRRRRAEEKAAGLPPQPSAPGPLPGLFTPEHPVATAPVDPETDEELDRWIDDFWKTPSEFVAATGETAALPPFVTPDALPSPAPNETPPELPTLPTPPTPPGETLSGILGIPSYSPAPVETTASHTAVNVKPAEAAHSKPVRWKSWARSLALTFLNVLVGFILGIAVHIELQKIQDHAPENATAAQRQAAENDVTDADTVTGSNILALQGTLLYTDEEGWARPDIEAVAIFLPVDSPPAIPFAPDGLGVGPETAKTREGMLAIEEIGGTCVRTNTSGRFDAILSGPGTYLVLYLSAASQRSLPDSVSPKDLDRLKRFFRDPETLIGKAQYCCREVAFTRDTRPLKYQFDYSR